MATVVESWMKENYPKYSLKILEDFEVYRKFQQVKKPYNKDDGVIRESYWIVDNCKIFEWTNKNTQTGEKIGYDLYGDTWFYEHWFPEVNCLTVVKTWLKHNHLEWGQIIKYYKDREEVEIWNIDEDSGKHFESFTQKSSRKQGNRYWFANQHGGRAESVERFWEDADESGFQKEWKTPASVGSESKSQRGSSVQGRLEKEEGDFYELKEYNEEDQHKWGKLVGKRAQHTWNERWDISPDVHMESKVYTDGPHKWGNKYRKRGGISIREEWIGADRFEEDAIGPGIEIYIQDLKTVYNTGKQNVIASQKTLSELGRSNKQFQAQIEELDVNRVSLPEPNQNDPQSLIEGIKQFQRLYDRQEVLKFTIISSSKADWDEEIEEDELRIIRRSRGALSDLMKNLRDSDKTISSMIEKYQSSSKQIQDQQIDIQKEIVKAQQLADTSNKTDVVIRQCSSILFRQEQLKQYLVNSPRLKNIFSSMIQTEGQTTQLLSKGHRDFVTKVFQMPENTYKQSLDKLIANITINLWLSKINNGEEFYEEEIEEIIKRIRRKAAQDAGEFDEYEEIDETEIRRRLRQNQQEDEEYEEIDELIKSKGKGSEILVKHLQRFLGNALDASQNLEKHAQNKPNNLKAIQDDAKRSLSANSAKLLLPIIKSLLQHNKDMAGNIKQGKDDEINLDDMDMEDISLSTVTMSNSKNNKTKGQQSMAGRSQQLNFSMEMSSSSSEPDINKLINQAKEAGDGIDQVIEQFDFLPEDHGLDVKNAELGSYIQKAEGLVNNKPTEAYNELIRVLEGQENIRKELYTYCNFEEEEIVSESTETQKVHTKDTKPHSQTITHEEYTLPTIPMYMVVNSLMQINEEIQRLIDNFAPSQDLYRQRLYQTMDQVRDIAKMNEEGQKEDQAVEQAATILLEQKILRDDILEMEDVAQLLEDLDRTQSQIINKLHKELGAPELAQLNAIDRQGQKNYIDGLGNQYKKLRILLALVKKILGEEFDDGDYEDVQEIVLQVKQKTPYKTEQNPIQTLKSCVNQSIQIADNLLAAQVAEQPQVLGEIKQEFSSLPAKPETSKLVELLFNLHTINTPLSAQLIDESELDLPKQLNIARLPLKNLSQLPKIEKSKLIPVDTQLAKQALENSLQDLTSLIDIASKPQTQRQRDLIQNTELVLQSLDNYTPHCGNLTLSLLSQLEKEQQNLLEEVKQAQNPQLLVKLISFLGKGADELSQNCSEETKTDLNEAQSKWSSGQGTELGYLKYFTNMLIRVLGDSKNKTIEQYEQEWEEYINTTQKSRSPKIPTCSSIDTDVLLQKYKNEQKVAITILRRLVSELGKASDSDQVYQFENESKDLVDYAGNELVDRYTDLRIAQSRFEDNLISQLKVVGDKLRELDSQDDVSLRKQLGELDAKVPQDQNQQEVAYFKEQAAKFAQSDEDGQDDLVKILIRLIQRGKLNSDIRNFLSEIQPSDDSEAQLKQNLRDIESRGYSSAHNAFSSLKYLAEQLGSPDQISNIEGLKSLTEVQGNNNTVSSLISSISVAFGNIDQMCERFKAILSEAPIQYILPQLVKGINDFNLKDQYDTSYVFQGLFKLSGGDEDKENARKLEQDRSKQVYEKQGLNGQLQIVQEQLDTILPARGKQSDLQRKLINSANQIRDCYDQVDLQRDELLKKVLRDTNSMIQSQDKASKGQFEGLRKQLKELDMNEYTTFTQLVDKAQQRVIIWENLENLRRKLKDQLNKTLQQSKEQLNEVNNKNSELEAAIQSIENRFNGQLQYLQQNLDATTKMAEKLGKDCNDKELRMSKQANEIKDLKEKLQEMEQINTGLTEDNDDANRQMQGLRKQAREKDSMLRDLQEQISQLEDANQKAYAGGSEKDQSMQKLLKDLRDKQQELSEVQEKLYELEQQNADKARNNQILQQEKDKESDKLQKANQKLADSNAKIVKLEADILEFQTNKEFTKKSHDIESLLEEKEQVIEELQGYLDTFRKYQALYDNAKQSNIELQEQIRKLGIDFSDAQLQLESLQGDQKRNAPKLAQLPDLQSKLQDLEGQNIALKNKLAALQSGGQNENEVLNKISDDLNSRDREIFELKQRLETLTGDMAVLNERFMINKKRSCLILFANAIKQMMRKYLVKWHYTSEKSGKPTETTETEYLTETIVAQKQQSEQSQFEIESDGPVSQELIDAYQMSEDDLKQENISLMESNPLLKTMRENPATKGGKPMTNQNAFKLLEEFMDQKFDVDQKDMEERKQPKSLPQFLLDYLLKQFGTEKIAMQNLGRLIPTLHQLYQENQPYGVLFCRLLQIFHPDPVDFNLSIFLTRARKDFASLIERAAKVRQVKPNDQLNTGGEAFLTDVVDMVTSLFIGDGEAGKQVVKMLRPNKVSVEDYVLFLISHRMVKMGVTPDDIFTMIDADGGGTLDQDELLQGLKNNLDIMLPDQVIIRAFQNLIQEEGGEIDKSDFVKMINVGIFMKNQRSDDYLVTKCKFLTSLIYAYQYIQRRDATQIRIEFKDTPTPITQEVFTQILLRLDPSLEKEKCLELYQEWSQGQVNNLGSLTQFIMRYGIGGRGLSVFGIQELIYIIRLSRESNIQHQGSQGGSQRVVKRRTVIEQEGSGDEQEVVTTRKIVKRGKKKVVRRVG